MSRLWQFSLFFLLVAAGAMQVKRNKPPIRIDPPESVADPNSYAYIRAAKARAEQNKGLEDDLALFADLPEPIHLNVDDPSVIEQAQWALRKLQGMSDSGIFKTIGLQRIINATFQPAVYHNNTIMYVDFTSPALLDGDPFSTHIIVVMTDLEDGVRSLAIDEFPIMEPDAIEEAWKQKVMLGREARAIELRKLDWEATRWLAKTGGVQECVDICDERQQSMNDFDFPVDDELLAIRADQAALAIRQAAPPDLEPFYRVMRLRKEIEEEDAREEVERQRLATMTTGLTADGKQTVLS